ncbi:MAG: diguanylate cyclase, partial [Desulfatitalea sp.]|nr:diguanylate cyclase [Desulfatitalea sp.]
PHVAALSYEVRFAVLVVWFALNYIYLQHLQRRTDRILQKSHDHLQQIATRLVAEMQVLSNADELARKTAAAMMDSLPFTWVRIYLFDEIRRELSGLDGHSHVLDDRLVPVLSRFNGVLEHQTTGAGPDLDRLQQPLVQWMNALKAAYVAPLVHNDGLIGVLVMPRKQNMKSLHPEEAAFVQRIAKTLALALSNARIHQHVTTLKDSLQARNDALNQEIAERERIAQSLQSVQDELRHANQALEKAILQANEMTARAEISNHVLTQEVEDRKRMAHMLQQSEERYRLVADNATDVIWTIDMNGRFTFISPSVEHCLGYTPEEMVDLEIRQVLTPESLKVAEQTIAEELRSIDKPHGIKRNSLATELEQVRKDGSLVWTEVNTRFIKDANRQVVGILGVTRDISERKKTEQELIYLAHHDALTGLLNRKAFVELLETEIKYARRHGSGLVLLYFDMNKFKTVNDTYGHEIGDRLLQSVAERLKGAVRETDHVARLGGDEFTIILKSPEKILSTIVAQRIVRDLAQPFEYDSVRVDFVTASIGIATFPRDGHTVAELMKSADKAMYQAKKGSVDWLHCDEVIAN